MSKAKKIVAAKTAPVKRTRTKKLVEKKVEPDMTKVQPPNYTKDRELTEDQLNIICKCMALDSLETIDMIKGNAFFTIEKNGIQMSISYSRFTGRIEIGYYSNSVNSKAKKTSFSFKEFEDLVKGLTK